MKREVNFLNGRKHLDRRITLKEIHENLFQVDSHLMAETHRTSEYSTLL